MCCVGAYLLTLGQAVYDSALAFSPCLCRAWRSARGESLGPSQLFSKHVPSPGHIHAFLESQEFVKFLKTIIPQSLSSPVIPPQSVQFVSCLPQTLSSLPHHFCGLHWYFKSSTLVYSSFYKRATEAQRGEVTFPSQLLSWEIRIGVFNSWTSALLLINSDGWERTRFRLNISIRLRRAFLGQRLRARVPCRVGDLMDWMLCWEGTLYEARWKTE